jgi:hypothetical protein
MFKSQGSDLKGLGEMEFAMNFTAEKEGVGFDGIGGHGAEDFDLSSAHESEADGGLHVGLEFGLDKKGSGIYLSFPSGGEVVSVERVGRVVK